jgi:hypothetical protein
MILMLEFDRGFCLGQDREVLFVQALVAAAEALDQAA